MAITVEQYNVSKQRIQNKHIKIQLLNRNLTPFYGAELSGKCIDGNVNVDSTADIRRTCSITFVVNDASFDIGESKYIWLNRYIELSVGIENLATDEIVWFPQGIFLIDAPYVDYSADSYTLRFTGLDMMATLTGTRNGYLEGIPTVIPQGTNVRSAIISILKLGGITNYRVEQCKLLDGTVQKVPNDITIDQGGTIYDMLVQLRDILPYYEIFFDENGTFVYQQIPTGEDEQIIATDDILKKMLISESIDTDFQSVKNVIEVYGRTISPAYYATNVAIENTTYEGHATKRIALTVPSYVYDSSLLDYIGFELPSAVSGNPILLNVNGEHQRTLWWQDRQYNNSHSNRITSLAKDIYMVNIHESGSPWELSNYGQIYGVVKDTNPKSPFYINKPEIGEIRQPLFGGEYDNITTNPLAYERAKWELYKRTRLQDNIVMTLVPIYYLSANTLITHAIKDTTEQLPYLIKSYSIDLKAEGTMSINAIRYYAEYPNI